MSRETVFVAVAAISEGKIRECEVLGRPHAGFVEVEWPNSFYGKRWLYKKQAHSNRAAAIADAEAKRKRRIASLRKQIAKLEAMNFAGEAAQ